MRRAIGEAIGDRRLASCYSVAVARHGNTFTFEAGESEGITLFIRLPLGSAGVGV
ncbi:MAG: hypothetical protein JW889_07325 [Verrucomicrobia bacterium]|nr:hypothetical protein [Verrucomicrobiota bacterium]